MKPEVCPDSTGREAAVVRESRGEENDGNCNRRRTERPLGALGEPGVLGMAAAAVRGEARLLGAVRDRMKLDGSREGRRWWAGIAGSVGFFLVGLAFLPGLVGREPAPSLVEEDVPARSAESPTAASDVRDPRGASAAGIPPVPETLTLAARSAVFDCMIAPSETIDIGSSITGVIESIAVERSSYVEAGQVLARLESRVEEAAVRVAQARAERTVELESTRVSLALGKKRRRRALDLYKGATLSLDLREEVETEAKLAALGVREAEENHRLAVLQLEQAQAALERRTVRSPVSGFVVERLMAPGEVVDEETILRIAQVNPLQVDVILPTHLFGAVRPGDPVEIVPEPPLAEARTAEVSIVDRVIDGASGTFGVRLMLPNPDHDLPGGLRCQARLLERDDAELARKEPAPAGDAAGVANADPVEGSATEAEADGQPDPTEPVARL
jgi:RND family efflux transporter MFP subunit